MLSPRLLYPLWDPSGLGLRIAQRLNWPLGRIQQRQFPDGESYLRILDGCAGQDVVLFAQLDHPDEKLARLLFAASQLREMGATSVGLLAPYLPYMRQDHRFQSGEALSSAVFAQLLSDSFDWLVTVDAHLHRYHSLSQIYTIPCVNLSAAAAQADYLRQQIPHAVLIGPDAESMQWVKPLAEQLGAPYFVLEKVRRGDREVSVGLSADGATLDLTLFRGRTPVLIDDILSTGMTLRQAAAQLNRLGLSKPWCLVTHALFSDQNHSRHAETVVQPSTAYSEADYLGQYAVLDGVVEKLVSCDSLQHKTNEICLDAVVALGLSGFLS